MEGKEEYWNEFYVVMKNEPKTERVVIGTDFSGNVGEGNRSDGQVWCEGEERERTDGDRFCEKDGNDCGHQIFQEECGAQRVEEGAPNWTVS